MDSKLELLHKVWGNLKNFSEMKPCTLDNMSRDAPAFLKGIAAVSFVDKNDQVRLDSFISIHLLIPSASISHNLVQRCVENLRKLANVERRFTVHEKRVSELGTDVWHGLRPIDSKREFVRYTLPGRAVVPRSDRSFGDLLGVIISLVSIRTSRKTQIRLLHFMARARKFGSFLVVAWTRDTRKNSLTSRASISFLAKNKEVLHCIQIVGDTVFFPYTWLHCVVTIGFLGSCASLLSVGLSIPRAVKRRKFEKAVNIFPVDERRGKTLKRGAACPGV